MLLVVISIYDWMQKTRPTIEDYVAFMEDRYTIKCHNLECTSFNIEVTENGINESVLMLAHSGGSSTKPTSITFDNYYFSEPGSKYQLRIKVKGTMGKFKILNETTNVMTIRD